MTKWSRRKIGRTFGAVMQKTIGEAPPPPGQPDEEEGGVTSGGILPPPPPGREKYRVHGRASGIDIYITYDLDAEEIVAHPDAVRAKAADALPAEAREDLAREEAGFRRDLPRLEAALAQAEADAAGAVSVIRIRVGPPNFWAVTWCPTAHGSSASTARSRPRRLDSRAAISTLWVTAYRFRRRHQRPLPSGIVMVRLRVPAVIALVACSPFAAAAPPDPQAVADRIDARILAALDADKVTPAGPASDAEFLRRVTLDVLGRIPTVAEARAFLADQSPDKRERLVDRLLASPQAVNHAAAVWRAALVPQAATNPDVQHLNVSLEAWLRDRLRAGRRADELARDLLTAPLDYLARDPANRPLPAPGPSPLAFYQANDLKPETVAAGVSRILLGVKIECAQCHDHPFDKWTQKQFWQTAAFFAPVTPIDGNEKPRPLAELLRRRSVAVNDTKEVAAPGFLDGGTPDWVAEPDPRRAFAAWATAKANPFFARATANRVWAQFFGVGLVDPVDDFNPENPPSHPELLDDLAAALKDADFDTAVLVRAITRTAAYRRTSKGTDPAQDPPRRFARMAVKGLTPEQLFDSLALATGYREEVPAAARAAFGFTKTSPRGQFLAKFAGGGQRTDAQTSILQALGLMNGAWITRQTDPEQGETLVAVADAPFLDDAGRVEALFLATVSRYPTAAEREKFVRHVTQDGPAGRKARLADVLWALVNSQEFLLNH
jgi:hypothetical protein